MRIVADSLSALLWFSSFTGGESTIPKFLRSVSLTTGLFLFSEEVCGTEEFNLSCLLEELRDDEDEIAIDKSSVDEAEAGEVFAFLLSFFSTPSSLFGMQEFNSVDFLCLLLLFSSEEALDFLAYKQTTNKYKIMFLK